MNIILNNIYYKQNKEIREYKDIYLDTSIGMLQVYVGSVDFAKDNDLQSMNRLTEIDNLKKKYGNLNIDEARRTYDNDMYLLISGKFILVIKYILNSNFEYSTQEFRIIENLTEANKTEFDDFKELDIVEFPSVSPSL